MIQIVGRSQRSIFRTNAFSSTVPSASSLILSTLSSINSMLLGFSSLKDMIASKRLEISVVDEGLPGTLHLKVLLFREGTTTSR